MVHSKLVSQHCIMFHIYFMIVMSPFLSVTEIITVCLQRCNQKLYLNIVLCLIFRFIWWLFPLFYQLQRLSQFAFNSAIKSCVSTLYYVSFSDLFDDYFLFFISYRDYRSLPSTVQSKVVSQHCIMSHFQIYLMIISSFLSVTEIIAVCLQQCNQKLCLNIVFCLIFRCIW